MNQREKLIELIEETENKYIECIRNSVEPRIDFGEFFADRLLANGVIVPPCKVGDTVYCIIEKYGLAGGLVFMGHIIKRKVDKLIFDGSRWEMMSDRVYPDYKDGNGLIYAYFDDLAFVDEEKANARLREIFEIVEK
jgi:hypothetical protein